MPEVETVHSHGVTFSRGTTDDINGAYTPVVGVRTATAPKVSRSILGKTSHDTSDKYQRKVKGMLSLGQFSVELLWSPEEATQQDLLADIEDEGRYYEILFEDGSGVRFFGLLNDTTPPSAGEDNVLIWSVGGEGSGEPTYV
jgi:hypothetical protein